MKRLAAWLSADTTTVRPARWVALVVVPAACVAALATTVMGSAATLPVDGGVVQVFVLDQPAQPDLRSDETDGTRSDRTGTQLSTDRTDTDVTIPDPPAPAAARPQPTQPPPAQSPAAEPSDLDREDAVGDGPTAVDDPRPGAPAVPPSAQPASPTVP